MQCCSYTPECQRVEEVEQQKVSPIPVQVVTVNVKLKFKYFKCVRDGSKTVDARLYYPSYRRVEPGMTIRFVCGKLMCDKIVDRKKVYGSFREMLVGEGVENCLPGVKDIDTGVSEYHGLYSENLRNSYQVVSFRLK